MVLSGIGKFGTTSRGSTGVIHVPAAVVRDSQFPLRDGKVKISIEDKRLIIVNLEK